MPTNREELLKAANIVKPALAAQAYVPALTHLRLDQDGITASDDISSLFVSVEHDMDCCVPGDLFIKAMTGFQTKDVKIASLDKEHAITLISGRSKLKLNTLGLADFPFQWPSPKNADLIKFNDEMLKGLCLCLISVGTNANHPAQMGVTLDQVDGHAVFYSTDVFTVSRYETATPIKLPADAPVIMPTFFCEQLLSLAKTFPTADLKLYLLEHALLLIVGDKDAMLHTRQLVDTQPLAFPDVIRRHLGSVDDLEKKANDIPDGWEDALQRSLLVLSSAIDKVVKMQSGDDEQLLLESRSDYGLQDDVLRWKTRLLGPVHLNPQLVLRGSGHCTRAMFGKTMLALCNQDASLVHLVAYTSPAK